MRSTELASLANVTVRTLRHYHQVGVLPEPPRGSNGYRDYTVHDLIRLLRIKRLAALGVSLTAMTSVLDADSDDHSDLLDQLDAAIDAEIARLGEQKALVQLIRAQQTAPDLPPELARFITMFPLAGRSAAANRVEREQAILVAHLLDARGIAEVTGIYERLARAEHAHEIAELTRQFDELDGPAEGPVVAALAERIVALLAPIIAELSFDGGTLTVGEDTATALLVQFQDTTMNPAQRAALELMAAGLTAALPAGVD